METKAQLITAIRAAARAQGTDSLSRTAFFRAAGGGGSERIWRHFKGWREACAAAGLRPNAPRVRLSDDELFSAMRDAFLKCGGIVPMKRFERQFRYSLSAFRNRQWNWNGTLVWLRAWLEDNDPAFPYLDQLPALPDESRGPRRWRPLGGTVCGDPLNFRGILHAPTHEIGVAMLFAVIAPDLGFAIESAQQAFPDCRAKRHVGKGRWEDVRVEFELRSRNFFNHRHDAKKCEIVVCWEHNWPKCPLEVIELKKEIEKLRKKGI